MMKTYGMIQPSPNAAEPYTIELHRNTRASGFPVLVDRLTPAGARKLARHLNALAKAAERKIEADEQRVNALAQASFEGT